MKNNRRKEFNMSLAPVVIFTFNRLEHTKKTIEALKKNILASESEVFIYSDGARNKAEEKIVNEVRKYIKEVVGFKSINIIEADKNKGLANSVINGVSDIIDKYGKIIVLEDDLVTSKFFLKYMNNALNLFERREDIWSISGYGPDIKIPNKYSEDTYITKRGCSWGWATWVDRWNTVDWNVEDYKQFKKNKNLKNRFNESGSDLSPMLNDQMEGRINSWAIRWGYSQFKKNMWTVYPVKSFVKNIGTDLSGTHSSMTEKYDVDLVENMITINANVMPENEVIKAFKRKYDLDVSGYFAIIIKKIGLYKPVRMIRNKVKILFSKMKVL